MDECDCILAFGDGKTKDTKYTLDYDKEKNKPVTIGADMIFFHQRGNYREIPILLADAQIDCIVL